MMMECDEKTYLAVVWLILLFAIDLIDCDARLEKGVAEIEEAGKVGSHGLRIKNGFVERLVR